MGTYLSRDSRNKCLICFKRCSKSTLRLHHHCCEAECEGTMLEIIAWEKHFLGSSLFEAIASDF